MRGGCDSCGLRVPGFDRVDDALMFRDGESATCVARPDVGAIEVRLTVESQQRITQGSVTSNVSDPRVKTKIEQGVTSRIGWLVEQLTRRHDALWFAASAIGLSPGVEREPWVILTRRLGRSRSRSIERPSLRHDSKFVESWFGTLFG